MAVAFCPSCGAKVPAGEPLAVCPQCSGSLQMVAAVALPPQIVPPIVARPAADAAATARAANARYGSFGLVGGIVGALFGVMTGYPLSYFVQPAALRMKLSLVDYVRSFDEIMRSSELATTAVGAWIGAVVLFGLLGLLLGVVLAAVTDKSRSTASQ